MQIQRLLGTHPVKALFLCMDGPQRLVLDSDCASADARRRTFAASIGQGREGSVSLLTSNLWTAC
uniref:Uncharacterized protein n=1 Tax=Anguilla anguilla TaxID=7936 RepID=A0A0E9Q719_ANGAN